MAKTDENDARILQQVPLDEFRECSLDFLRLKELLMVYRKLQRRVRKIRQWDNDVHLQSSKDYISEAKEKMAEIEDEIHKIAMGSLPMYREVLQFIGSEKSIDVAELLTLLDVSRGFKKLRRFTGHLASKKRRRPAKPSRRNQNDTATRRDDVYRISLTASSQVRWPIKNTENTAIDYGVRYTRRYEVRRDFR